MALPVLVASATPAHINAQSFLIQTPVPQAVTSIPLSPSLRINTEEQPGSTLPLTGRMHLSATLSESQRKAQALLITLHQNPRYINVEKARKQEKIKAQGNCTERFLKAIVHFFKSIIDWVRSWFISRNNLDAMRNFDVYQGNWGAILYPDLSPVRRVDNVLELGKVNPFIQWGALGRRFLRFCENLPTRLQDVESQLKRIVSDYEMLELPTKFHLPSSAEDNAGALIAFLSDLKPRFVQTEEHLYSHHDAYCYLSFIGKKSHLISEFPNMEAREFIFKRLKQEDREFLESTFKQHCQELNLQGKGFEHFLSNSSQALITHAVDAMLSEALAPLLA